MSEYKTIFNTFNDANIKVYIIKHLKKIFITN